MAAVQYKIGGFMNLNAAIEKDEKDEEIVDAELLPVSTTLSLAVVKPSFADLVDIVDERIKTAGAVTVQDEESQKFAVALVGEAKRIIKDIDARKKSLKEYKEAKSFLDNLNSFAKGLTEKFEKIVNLADPKVKSYMAKIELERRQAEEAARKAAKALQDKIDAEVAEANRKAREEAARKAEEELRAKQAKEAAERKETESKKEAAERAKREAAEIEAARKAAEEETATHDIAAPQVAQQNFPTSSKITRTETGVSAFAKKPWIFEILEDDKIPREFCSPDKQKIRNAVKQGVREIAGCRIFEDTQVNYRS
jgi:hypothetical protein